MLVRPAVVYRSLSSGDQRIQHKPRDGTPSDPDYGPVVEAREDRKEPRDQEMNLITLGVAWMSENPDTCKTAGLIVVEEPEKLTDSSVK